MLVVGAGGGRDVLSALVFEQASVVGVEMNGEHPRHRERVFGDFTGHLDRHPKVRFANDEARSWVARSDGRFDVIQISLIDSWAATAAGAFVLTEHSLYTVEAWRIFLDHLEPGGILTVTRYYLPGEPGDRVPPRPRSRSRRSRRSGSSALATTSRWSAWARRRATRVPPWGRSWCRGSLHGRRSVVLVRPERLEFVPVLDPDFSPTTNVRGDRRRRRPLGAVRGTSRSTSPRPDDRPFFFHMLRLRDAFDPERLHYHGLTSFNRRAVFVLGTLLATVSLSRSCS